MLRKELHDSSKKIKDYYRDHQPSFKLCLLLIAITYYIPPPPTSSEQENFQPILNNILPNQELPATPAPTYRFEFPTTTASASSSKGDCHLLSNSKDNLHSSTSTRRLKASCQTDTSFRMLDNQESLKDQQIKALDGRIKLIKKFVYNFIVEDAKKRRRVARYKCDENCVKLVSLIYRREGHALVEHWQNGSSFRELYVKEERLKTRKEEIEKLRKNLNKRRPVKKGVSLSLEEDTSSEGVFSKPQSLSPLSLEEYNQLDEVLKLRVLQHKKKEADLYSEFEKLEKLRNLHIREYKRIQDEERSFYNNFPILNGRYVLLELLGRGGFSEVMKGFDLEESRYVACKIHSLNNQWSEERKENYIKHACREYNIHKALDHTKVVRLIDVFEIHHDSFCTVLEYCEGHDLDFYLKQKKILSERVWLFIHSGCSARLMVTIKKEAKSIVVQLFDALRYLNELVPPVIHYDLKPANIMYHKKLVKITDFGLSKVMETTSTSVTEMELTSQGTGTYWYLPPETFQSGPSPPTISSKVDVWSVGIIFYQCLYGKRPFGDGLSQQSILQQQTILNAKEVTFPPKPFVTQETKDFIKQCLAYNKEERLDVLSTCKLPYLFSCKTGK
ncbi:hypothetical protein Zmor_004283 [Zophobas morio]|uniref:Protein kinase domain-containing protein n=1 Tax=Zophobas morio TaxID=2755281 RepID=A0AA38M0D0_9CUCU|nr:hypothetical protein Zmor_004283 [Zophobas morio]